MNTLALMFQFHTSFIHTGTPLAILALPYTTIGWIQLQQIITLDGVWSGLSGAFGFLIMWLCLLFYLTSWLLWSVNLMIELWAIRSFTTTFTNHQWTVRLYWFRNNLVTLNQLILWYYRPTKIYWMAVVRIGRGLFRLWKDSFSVRIRSWDKVFLDKLLNKRLIWILRWRKWKKKCTRSLKVWNQTWMKWNKWSELLVITMLMIRFIKIDWVKITKRIN